MTGRLSYVFSMVLILLLCGCCARSHTNDIAGKILYDSDLKKKNIKYNAFFSWRQEKGYDTVYIWNGKQVGKNQAGFEAVLLELATLPMKSRVNVKSKELTIFDYMNKVKEPLLGFEVKFFSQPTLLQIENNQDIIDIVNRRQLTLVLSWTLLK